MRQFSRKLQQTPVNFGVNDYKKTIKASRQNENFGEKRLINPKYFERDETENLVATYCHGRNLQPLGQSNQSAARQSNMQMQGDFL